MYNADELKAGLIGLMGWKQNEDSSSWQLTEMLTSETGTFYNTAHPLLTFDNLVSISKRYDDLTLIAVANVNVDSARIVPLLSKELLPLFSKN